MSSGYTDVSSCHARGPCAGVGDAMSRRCEAADALYKLHLEPHCEGGLAPEQQRHLLAKNYHLLDDFLLRGPPALQQLETDAEKRRRQYQKRQEKSGSGRLHQHQKNNNRGAEQQHKALRAALDMATDVAAEIASFVGPLRLGAAAASLAPGGGEGDGGAGLGAGPSPPAALGGEAAAQRGAGAAAGPSPPAALGDEAAAQRGAGAAAGPSPPAALGDEAAAQGGEGAAQSGGDGALRRLMDRAKAALEAAFAVYYRVASNTFLLAMLQDVCHRTATPVYRAFTSRKVQQTSVAALVEFLLAFIRDATDGQVVIVSICVDGEHFKLVRRGGTNVLTQLAEEERASVDALLGRLRAQASTGRGKGVDSRKLAALLLGHLHAIESDQALPVSCMSRLCGVREVRTSHIHKVPLFPSGTFASAYVSRGHWDPVVAPAAADSPGVGGAGAARAAGRHSLLGRQVLVAAPRACQSCSGCRTRGTSGGCLLRQMHAATRAALSSGDWYAFFDAYVSLVLLKVPQLDNGSDGHGLQPEAELQLHQDACRVGHAVVLAWVAAGAQLDLQGSLVALTAGVDLTASFFGFGLLQAGNLWRTVLLCTYSRITVLGGEP